MQIDLAIQSEVPEAAYQLSAEQKNFLAGLKNLLDQTTDPEELQKTIYENAKDLGLPSKDAFGAIYTALLGKSHGPKAGWLILSLDKEFIKKRFGEIAESSALSDKKVQVTPFNHTDVFVIDQKVATRYPTLSVGIAIIKNVTIKDSDANLEKERTEFLKSLQGLTTDQINSFPEIVSYRKVYKETGIDWHSRRPSPEALLRRIALNKRLYSVNTCVDAYNLCRYETSCLCRCFRSGYDDITDRTSFC